MDSEILNTAVPKPFLRPDATPSEFQAAVDKHRIGAYLGEFALAGYSQFVMDAHPNRLVKEDVLPKVNVEEVEDDYYPYGRDVIKAAMIDGMSVLFHMGFMEKDIVSITTATLHAINRTWLDTQLNHMAILNYGGDLLCSPYLTTTEYLQAP